MKSIVSRNGWSEVYCTARIANFVLFGICSELLISSKPSPNLECKCNEKNQINQFYDVVNYSTMFSMSFNVDHSETEQSQKKEENQGKSQEGNLWTKSNSCLHLL